MPRTFVVIYRTGGTENFRWNRGPVCRTREQAQDEKAAIEKMGYACRVHDADMLGAVGLPETYEA